MGNRPLAAGKLPPLAPGEFRFVTKSFGIGEDDSDGRRRFHTIASSTIKDMRNDEIEVTGLEDMRDEFRRGLAIFMNHVHEVPEHSFGMSDSAEIKNSGMVDNDGNPIWDLHIGGFVDMANPRAVQLSDSIRGGMKFGASIGAIVPKAGFKRNADGGMKIAHLAVKEASIVGIPMNQRSWVQKAADAAEALVEDDAIDEPHEGTELKGVGDQSDGVSLSTSSGKVDPSPGTESTSADIVTEVDKALDNTMLPVFTGSGTITLPAGTIPVDGPIVVGETITKADGELTTKDEDAAEPPIEPTPGGQEADAATPETAPEAEDAETDPAETQKALTFDAADVAQLVLKTKGLIERIGTQDAKIASLELELAATKVERDRLATQVAEQTEAITKVASMPLRPRAAGLVKTMVDRYPGFDPEVAATIDRLTS